MAPGKQTCQTCKARKVRCDGNKPSCGRCVKSRRTCSYADNKRVLISFRHSNLSALVAAADRVDNRDVLWPAESPYESEIVDSNDSPGPMHHSSTPTQVVASPGSQEQADYTDSTLSAFCGAPGTVGDQILSEARVANADGTVHSFPRTITQHEPISSPAAIYHSPRDVHRFPETITEHGQLCSPAATLHTQSITVDRALSEAPAANGTGHGSLGQITHHETTSSPATTDSVPKPLTRIEGDLLHFYVQNIGPWLDVTSPERHYTYTVPGLAIQCPLLLYAIMACSAHLLRLIEKHPTDLYEEEEKYQAECIRLLIPVLNDVASAVQDEAVLATIAILRMSEQYDEYHVDRQCHLVPSAFSHFGAEGPASTSLGGLRQATFYSYVRADIRMAILGRCGTRLSVSSWPLSESSPSTDADWANRITWLLVHAINLCYGGNAQEVLPYTQLSRLIDEWKISLPPTFEPYFYEETDREPFPVIRLLCPWHVVGHQFYHASKILLAVHHPPNEVFSDVLQFKKHLEAEVLKHARMLCAISFSNEHFGGRINASHLLAMGAQYFTGREEQWRVLDYFNSLQTEKAWPSRACQEMLKEAWAR